MNPLPPPTTAESVRILCHGRQLDGAPVAKVGEASESPVTIYIADRQDGRLFAAAGDWFAQRGDRAVLVGDRVSYQTELERERAMIGGSNNDVHHLGEVVSVLEWGPKQTLSALTQAALRGAASILPRRN